MKRIFTIITVLISLSLIGLTMIQISWLRNMMLLREEQIQERVIQVTKDVGAQLSEHIGSYAAGGGTKLNILPNDFAYDLFRNNSVGQHFSVQEIQEKLQSAFNRNDLRDIKFEFAIQSITKNGLDDYFEKKSENFITSFEDTVHYKTFIMALTPPGGTVGENLSPDEALYVVIPSLKKVVVQSLRWRIVASALFTLIILAAFYLTVRTMLRQKKLGEIKNDFINNMTHEFKTPIATISLAVDAMRNEKVIADRTKLNYFSGIIKEENQRMNRQVETILKASQLERQEVNLVLKPLHAQDIIRDVAETFTLQLNEKQGRVELNLQATADRIDGDEVHFSNLVNNLIDNAVKYARENIPPVIKISTQSSAKYFIFRIEDNGIGMNRETLKKIFERFYRAHTGNVHNVKGFGLGLSYVKTMVEAHHGEIKAESTLGKGSTFTLEIPLSKAPEEDQA